MRIIAPMMILIMMTSTLAGCTGGDPDGGGNDEIDMDVLNQLIDDNLQDFINNTTITVENHYHNNTTIVNDNTDNSISNINGSDNSLLNGAGDVYLLDIQFSLDDLYPGWNDIDYRNNTFNYTWEYYDYPTNQNRVDLFEISCQVFYVVGANSTNSISQVSYWQDSSQYYNAWSNMYNSTVRSLIQDAAYSNSVDSLSNQYIQQICNEDYTTQYSGLLYEIPIIEGMALKAFSEPSFSYYQNQYVWVKDCNTAYGFYGDYSWQESYRPECGNSSYSYGAFDISYEYETISWSYGYGGWVGGSSDSVLEVYVNSIRPDWNYRLIVYFEMTTSMNNFE